MKIILIHRKAVKNKKYICSKTNNEKFDIFIIYNKM